jgi:predicted nuclease with TOPRIM domain
MAGPNPGTPFRRIEELEQENEALREQLRQKQAELEEADAEQAGSQTVCTSRPRN